MNLHAEILREHSKKQTMKIVKWLGDDPVRFKNLMEIFLRNDDVVAPRAAWILSYSGTENPELLRPWHKKLIDHLSKKGTHPAVRRNIVRVYQFVPVPKNLQGKLVDRCFQFLTSRDEPVAVKAFSMTILKNIAKENPELKNEVKLVVEEILPYSSAGIRSRAKCLFRELA